MSTVTTPTGVRIETVKGSVTLDRIYENQFQKPGTLTAQLRQIVHTKSHYPSQKVASDMQTNVFDIKEFGFSEQTFESDSARMAWILVPKGTTAEVVIAKLEAAMKNGACIYRVLSNAPILDENQTYAINAGIRTFDHFANSQVARYPDTKQNQEKGIVGKIQLDPKGLVQYRRTYFWNSPKEDIDLRGKITPFVSDDIKAELSGASVMAGQTIL